MIFMEEKNKEVTIKLTERERDLIIEELERVSHNIYDFLDYNKIIKKLKGEKPIVKVKKGLKKLKGLGRTYGY